MLTPVFEVDFNLEYWSCQIFGGDSKLPKKTHQVVDEEGITLGRLEVGSYANMNLEPFDRLVMLALIQLWYDQGADGQGRIAFSYRELFRRLGLKAGGRQTQQIKDALDRLRRCFITLVNCFKSRNREGKIIPVEAEADPFTILRLKQTATLGSGKDAQRLVVCQLAPVVLSGMMEPGQLRPRVHSEIIQKLRAKNSTAILLHGFYNGRLQIQEKRYFAYKDVGKQLGIHENYHSNLVNRLRSPHEKLEAIGAIAIEEERALRRKEGLTITLLAPPQEQERPAITIELSNPKRVAIEKKDKDQIPLFEQAPVAYDEQLLLGFRAAGVKNILFLLKRYGRKISERELWALLENVRAKNADEKWTWRRGPDAYVAKCLNDGFYVPEDYKTPKERIQQVQQVAEQRQEEESQRVQARQLQAERLQILGERIDEETRVALEDGAIERLLDQNAGFRAIVRPIPGAHPQAPVEQRYKGLGNSLLRESFEKHYHALLLEIDEA